MQLGLVKILKIKFSRNAEVCLVDIPRMKLDQDFFWTCDMTWRSYFGKQKSTLGSVKPFAMFLISKAYAGVMAFIIKLYCPLQRYIDL